MRMNKCESRKHYLEYYKIYIPNQHTNLSAILEWQKKIQIVSHKNYNLSGSEGFCNIFDFQVDYMLYWRFHFGNEIPINCLFIQWNWPY